MMTDSDYDIIRPTEVLQNVGGLAPAKYRQGRKKRQNLREQDDSESKLAEGQLEESIEKDTDGKITENDQDSHAIDYCA
jgi:hypothetical protein